MVEVVVDVEVVVVVDVCSQWKRCSGNGKGGGSGSGKWCSQLKCMNLCKKTSILTFLKGKISTF